MALTRGAYLSMALLLAGCAGQGAPAMVAAARTAAHAPATPHGVVSPPPDARPAPSQPLVALPASTRRLIDSGGNGTLTGTVAFKQVTDAFFGDSAASFQLLALPATRALISISSLTEDIYATNGRPITATTDATGAFKLTGGVPTDQPFVVNALIAGDHRLSALVPAGATSVAIDEYSTMMAEEARWQLPDAQTSGKLTFAQLDAATLGALATKTSLVARATDFASSGTVPTVATLQSGNGLALRNAYVLDFGRGVTTGGATPSDQLSDQWRSILGYRPLALVNESAVDPTQLQADDAVEDAAGNLYVAPHNNFLIYIPAKDRGPLPGADAPLKAGHLYNLAGEVNGGSGPGTLEDYNKLYNPIETASVTDPSKAPYAGTSDGPIWMPYRLLIEPDASAPAPHVFFTSRQGHRLYFVPAKDLTRYGRSFLAGRQYTLAGNGAVEAPGATQSDGSTAYLLGDGGPAYSAPLAYPLGVAEDSRHNLYISDAGSYAQDTSTADPLATHVDALTGGSARYRNYYHQSIRMIRASDGKIFTLRLTQNGQPYPLSGAQDLRVVEGAGGNYVYVTDSLRHAVIRFALPANLASLDATAPASQEVQVVLGKLDTPGSLVAGAPAPTLATLNDGVSKDQVLLDTPTSLDFDASGNMLVADNGHVRMLEAAGLGGAGKVYLLAGAINGGYDEGDSRLVATHARYMTRQPGVGDMIIVDDLTGAVRRLVTGRGSR